jgi:hypothetical protein
MRNFFWTFIKDTADTGSWRKSHAALCALIPAIALLGWLIPNPPWYLYLPVCMVLGNLFKHAVLFPVSVRLMDRRQARQYAG